MTHTTIQLEVCTPTWQSVVAAVEGGANRIELCSALGVGGLTPSYGLIHKIHSNYPDLRIMALIRPREGNFVYGEAEAQVIEHDIAMAVHEGAAGIVVGALTPEGTVNEVLMQRFIHQAGACEVTFHRAIDHCVDPLAAIDVLIRLGCTRVLTSGAQPAAEQGTDMIRQMVQRADGRLVVMAGSGINAGNVRRIVDATGVTEVHASASAVVYDDSPGNRRVPMTPHGYAETSADKVKALLEELSMVS